MKKSAGILIYRKKNEKIEVLLCHMGGPYWAGIEKGGWSLPKGEMRKEKAIDTALREFKEETSFLVEREKLEFLGSKRQPSGKFVIMFSSSGDYDASKSYSNTFKKEWPKSSGKIEEFPEMDRADWFEIEKAKDLILSGQVYFLSKLEKKLYEETK